MTSSKISFPTYYPASQIGETNQMTDVTYGKLHKKNLHRIKKEVKTSIIYSVSNSNWKGSPGVSISIPSFIGFYRKSWQTHGTEGQIHKTGLSKKNKNTPIPNYFFSSDTVTLLRASMYLLHKTIIGKHLPKQKLSVKTSSQQLEYFLQLCAI